MMKISINKTNEKVFDLDLYINQDITLNDLVSSYIAISNKFADLIYDSYDEAPFNTKNQALKFLITYAIKYAESNNQNSQ